MVMINTGEAIRVGLNKDIVLLEAVKFPPNF